MKCNKIWFNTFYCSKCAINRSAYMCFMDLCDKYTLLVSISFWLTSAMISKEMLVMMVYEYCDMHAYVCKFAIPYTFKNIRTFLISLLTFKGTHKFKIQKLIGIWQEIYRRICTCNSICTYIHVTKIESTLFHFALKSASNLHQSSLIIR